MKLHLAVSITVSALLAISSAHAAEIYRWVDENGRTHVSDVVPEKYRKSAKKIESRAYEPSAKDQKEAQERAELEKARAAQAVQPRAAGSAPSGGASAVRPANAPGATDCATLRRRYRESLACFGPYRTATGGTKAEAFEKCTPVDDPVLQCGPETSN